ncbi:DUF3108 domain-containing protein [Inhella crocodyli]|uniref:DUF3108 domain-containing protein n=1 Tax=Inhella crocodyli TaxID=2499851 RepID=A0A437LTN8_9BURK|nr:DUF3108 domain-containing protein [Inhella crocodyli]RVT88613.1 DUF3108 domain-containing protein [Inhella crocodyli]
MLLLGRGRHLSPRVLRRTVASAWCLVVLLAHWAAWRAFDGWHALTPSPPPRLSVQLTQAMRPAPERARPVPRPKPPSPRATPEPAPAASQPQAPTPAPQDAAEPASAPPALEPAPPPAQAVASAPSEPTRPEVQAPREGDDAPGPEWPLSTRLRYAVVGHYQGLVHGDAEVEWLRQGARYQVRLQVGIGPKLTPFGQRRLVSEGRLTPSGIAPQRYDEATQLLWRTARQSSIRWEGGEVRLPSGQRVFAPAGVQDSASQFVHLTWLLLTGREPAREGHVIPVPLALPQGVNTWRYENLGEVVLDTALGRIRAWHLRPQAPLPAGALAAQVWLAPSYQYLPVQIRIEQGDGVWLLLTLAEPPLQELAPTDNPGPSKENPP